MARLGPCDRCFEPRPATTVETLVVGTSKYELELCEQHADMLQVDLFKWTRLGTLVEADDGATYRSKRSAPAKQAEPAIQVPVVRPQPVPVEVGKRNRGTVVAGYVHVPVAKVVEIIEDDVPREPKPQSRQILREALPRNHDRWTWAQHALERFIEREAEAKAAGLTPMTVEEVLWTAEHPDTIRPSSDAMNPDLRVHVRGHMHVVVNPIQARIVTVVDRRLRTPERNLQHVS